jgi:cytochrome P450
MDETVGAPTLCNNILHSETEITDKLRPHSYVSHVLPSNWCIKLASFQIGSYIQNRIEDTDKYGTKRDDLLQHLIDHAPESQRTSEELIKRMWSLNLGSVHTSAIVGWKLRHNHTKNKETADLCTCQTITAAIFMLSQEVDKYVPELRAEIEEHCPRGEFTKENLDKLVKLDSFLRESCRLNDFGVGKE